MPVLTFRTDPEVDRAIEYLVTQTGDSKSDVLRDAVLKAERDARREALRQESLILKEDPADLAEVQAVRTYLGDSDAW